ncbi:hypothetical protein [Embleya scabrispora]|uniref:hypothetical protein n=1 Tax=Embleya scabrispora TaxID=159449 RepID=UPI00035C5816|nr:hypothetical protein [Embleya scabrispora]
MTTAVRTAQDCKLSYALTTTPNPLTASPPNIVPGTEDEHAFADIDIVVSNSGNTPVRCSRIAIVLPVGSRARDIAVTGEGIDAYVSPETEWTVVDIQSDVLLAIPTAETAVFAPTGDDAEPSVARFEVIPRSGRDISVDGLYIHLAGIKVSTKSGIARIDIEEWATDTEGPLPEVPNTMKLDVAKFPFRSGSDPHPGIGRALVALEGTGRPPATKIAAGAPVVLEWHHQRGDNHELYADGKRVGASQAELEAIAGGSRWPIDAGLTRDTAFALKTSTPTPTSGHVVRWDHVTVCVSNPTLDALTVSDTLHAQGPTKAHTTLAVGGELVPGSVLSVAGMAAATTVTATGEVKGATVTGTTAVNGAVVTATGEVKGATVTGTTAVNGAVVTATGEVKGATVTATGQVRGATISATEKGDFASATIGGTLTVQGAVALSGAMSTLWPRFQVPTGNGFHGRSFKAQTAGLVVGVVDVGDTGTNGTVRVLDQAGTTLAYAAWEHRGSATVVARINKDQTFQVGSTRRWDPKGDAYCTFYWLPFGSGAATALALDDPEPNT